MARNAITGADTVAALKVATTFGTAATFAAGDRIEFEGFDAGRNPAELTASPKGSGQIMANESQQGAISPTISIQKLEHFNDAGVAAEAVFWGSEGVTTIQTPSAFTHSFTCADTFNNSYLTAAFQFTGGSIMEAASCAVTSVAVSYKPNDYSRVTLELLANDIIQEGVVNSYSAMQSLTVANSERVVAFPDDEFLINIQSGSALTSPTDRLGTVEQIDITYEKPQEHTQEFKGSLGNGQPVPVGDPPFTTTVSVTLSGYDASTFPQRARENVEWKASFSVTGSLLIGGAYAKVVREFPRLKLVKDPVYSISSAGINKVTLEFKALVAASAPSGMLSTYPAVKITNGRYAGYL